MIIIILKIQQTAYTSKYYGHRKPLRLDDKRFVTSTLFEFSIIMGSAGAYVLLRETNELFRAVLPLALLLMAFEVLRKNSNELLSNKD